MRDLAACLNQTEAHALAYWAQGIAALVQGQMQDALSHLDRAAEALTQIGNIGLAAETQVPKLAVLAMLGRYDEAQQCGLASRDVFSANGNGLAAAKIELNLGHMHMQRDSYDQAEALFRSADARFAGLGNIEHRAMSRQALADALTWQRKFDAAAALYHQVIADAQAASLRTIEATSTLNVGVLEQLRGQYDRALHWLESARRIFYALQVPHQLAQAEERLASAYLDLGLADKALAAYERAVPAYANAGLAYEQAWALADQGRAHLQLGHYAQAQQSLQRAHALFVEENNPACAAMTTVLQAELAATQGNFPKASELAEQAVLHLQQTHAPSWLLLARWLHGETRRTLNDPAAETLLQAVLCDATGQAAPEVARRCRVSLGLWHAANSQPDLAQDYFLQAVKATELQREVLPAEELRTAFLSDRLTPYHQMAKLARHAGEVKTAFHWVERARARALLDMLRGAITVGPSRQQPRNADEAALLAQLHTLRAELNWCYSQLNERHATQDLSEAARKELTRLAHSHEAEVQAIMLRLQQHGQLSVPGQFASLDLPQLQAALGEETALVSYFVEDDDLLAFMVTRDDVVVVPQLAPLSQVEAWVSQTCFQMDAMRHGSARMSAHLPQLLHRTQHYLGLLHGALLRPLLPQLGQRRRLVVVPHGVLHYVPFAALFDGATYAGETYEISLTPSAAALQHCLSQPQTALRRALLLGVADERAPRVRDEVKALAALFPESHALVDEQATLPALRELAPHVDVLHLACHGLFRPDSPFFSALRLGDGWMTVRDSYELTLRCGLVTLSACETGISVVAPGDELIGLARGFMAAGTPSLLVSLWTVDDAATAELMRHFYEALLAGQRPAAALRAAQHALRQTHPHPFFWSAFNVVGRW